MKPRIAGAALVALVAGCRTPPPVMLPPEACDDAVAARVVPASHVTPASGGRPGKDEGGRMEDEKETPGGPGPFILHPSSVILADAPRSPAAPDFAEPLSLADAVAYGLANNPRLREAAARADAARAGADVAFADYLPQFGTSHRYSAFDTPVIPGGNFVPASLNAGAYAYYIGELGVRWTIYDFGRTAGRFGRAVSQTEVAELTLSRARQAVAFEAARGYFRLLFAGAVLRVREQALRQAEAVLQDTQARRAGGVADREAVLRAEVEVSQAREELVAARQLAADARANLNQVLGRPAHLPLAVRDLRRRPTLTVTLDECLARAAADRPEVGIGRAAVAAAAYGERAARGELLPNIFVRGTVIRADSPGPVEGWSTGAGVHLEQPLYHGGRHLAELRRSRAEVAAAAAALQSTLDDISQQVCVAHQALATQQERIRLGETAVGQARENLRLTIVKYKNGDATPTDVVDAQTALTRAETRYHSAVYDYLEGLARLEYAQGGDQGRLLGLLCEP